jgi:hypothetical protein
MRKATETLFKQYPNVIENLCIKLRRKGGDEECRSSTGTARMEFISYTFKSATFSSPIYVEMYYLEYPVGTWMTVTFNDQTYETPTTVITKHIYDSIAIGTKVFYKATRFANELNPASTAQFLVYNAEYGILKFRFQTGEEWELLTKP